MVCIKKNTQKRKSGCKHNTTKYLTRTWRTDHTCAVTRRRTGLNHFSQYLTQWFPARDNQTSGVTSPSFRSRVYATLLKTCARRNTERLHPFCAQRTSLRASDSPDKVQHQLSPPKLRIPLLCDSSYNTISPLLHVSSRGNDPIDSSDLLDSCG